MDGEVGITAAGGGLKRPTPHPLMRLAEIGGLVLMGIGIGGASWLAGLAGAALVVGSYAAYRMKHPDLPPLGRDGSDGGDGGGD